MGLGVPTRHKWVKCSYYISHFMFNENSYRINEIPQKKKGPYDLGDQQPFVT